MALVVTLAGHTIAHLTGTFSLEQVYGARRVCSFSWYDEGGVGHHPALDEVVTVTDGATTIFGGIVTQVGEGGVIEPSVSNLIRSVTATDFTVYCDQRVVNKSYAVGQHLNDILSDLVTTYLSVFSVTLDGAQAQGAAFTEISWRYLDPDRRSQRPPEADGMDLEDFVGEGAGHVRAGHGRDGGAVRDHRVQ